jgi:prevent-host-death family protein
MSAFYNMHDAKTHLSQLAERAANGEEIVIARNGRPLARLVPLDTPLEPRKLRPWLDDAWASDVWAGDDFDLPLPSETPRHLESEGEGEGEGESEGESI